VVISSKKLLAKAILAKAMFENRTTPDIHLTKYLLLKCTNKYIQESNCGIWYSIVEYSTLLSLLSAGL